MRASSYLGRQPQPDNDLHDDNNRSGDTTTGAALATTRCTISILPLDQQDSAPGAGKKGAGGDGGRHQAKLGSTGCIGKLHNLYGSPIRSVHCADSVQANLAIDEI
jgi:hypothetical protein